jgi:hypothetical protein
MNKNLKWIYNPFERIAGWQALFMGVALMALTAVAGKINHVAFDGILDVHAGATFSFTASFAMQAVNFPVLFLTMWLAGVCFSKSRLRTVDVAGTMALARAPMLLLAMICFLPVAPASLFDIPRVIAFLLISIPFIIWMIALMYNAYTVSCHLKGVRAVVSFIGALLVAEIASKLIFIFLLGSLFAAEPIKDGFSSGSKENMEAIDSLTIRQKAENVVKAFEQSDFNTITVYFDETMKKGLSPSGLRIAWTQNTLTCGKFEKADTGDMKETRIDRFDVIEVPFYFARAKRNLRLVFNEDGTIAGLFFLPVN